MPESKERKNHRSKAGVDEMSKADEDFECENLILGKVCGKQAPDVQMRPDPLLKGVRIYICDACLELTQELADRIKEKNEQRV